MDLIELEKEVEELRRLLQKKENELCLLKQNLNIRYSRQILLPEIGVKGQEKLMRGRVLIVGAGGLGCPAGVYLAGAGVGELGLVDYDAVDITNIHRQFLHGEKMQNISKADSAARSLRSINSRIKITAHNIQLSASNALEIASLYDVILDCSDNVPTRYLLNDVSVLTKIPLISGSALKMEGQLTIYGYREVDDKKKERYTGPCYRCLFPSPPPPEAVGSCSANGVSGPVPGTIGCLQALEAIKLLVGRNRESLLVQRMLIFDGDDMTFRTVKLRSRNDRCAACSDNATLTELIDYEALCSMPANDKELDLHILPPEHRIGATELVQQMNKPGHLLVDVRSENEYQMCCIEGAVNYPIDKLEKMFEELMENISGASRVTFICRRGNDSQVAAKLAMEKIEKNREKIQDVEGGLHAWAKYIDRDFPVY
ncbi:adenylyltransferase and sulfurtransferase MOCS3 [Leptidea sinapis]|uniref:adenylyltransferase and sulfurtransferase MOCS3 n=1 Tax=Leptidea sinapis TaxID=189913 RepID=UPI0021C410FD|nr:adenylyltransferase and sulfurtransferase MOCS3 [Leptidea sinapis]